MSENRQHLVIALIVIVLGVFATTAKAEPRHTCGATHVAKTNKKVPAPEPQRVEKTNRTVTAAALPAHKEFQLAAVEIPTTVKVNGKADEHFVIETEAGAEVQPEIRAGLVEAHVVAGSFHYHD